MFATDDVVRWPPLEVRVAGMGKKFHFVPHAGEGGGRGISENSPDDRTFSDNSRILADTEIRARDSSETHLSEGPAPGKFEGGGDKSKSAGYN